MTEASPAKTIELDSEELSCLRLALELYGDEHCPFGDVEAVPAARLEVATRHLVARGLVEKRGFRPDRDLTRRLLVLSEPDARVVLLRAGPASAERVVDVFERTGVQVSYGRPADRHQIGPVLEPAEVFEDLSRRFTVRRSTGDFIDLRLDAAEHFAFMTFAQELTLGRQRPAVITGEIPVSPVEPTLDGAILVAGKRRKAEPGAGQLPVPNEAEWKRALATLEDKDVIRKKQDGFHLKPYLRDLAVGLVHEIRYVLTRFDYRAEEWDVRDVTLVPVPGSLFSFSIGAQGSLRITELDVTGLERALHDVVDAPGEAG